MSTRLVKNPYSFRYVLLPARATLDTDELTLKLQNAAYAHWERFWREFWVQTGMPESFDRDQYFRQDLIAVLFDGDEVVGSHLYTFFNLKQLAAKQHSYFDCYTERTFKRLQEKSAFLAMSMECLSVESAYRRSAVGVPLAEVLIGCALKVMQEFGAHVAIGPARTEVRVNEMCKRFGIEITEAVIKETVPCEIVAGFPKDITPNTDSTVQALVEHFWAYREDHTLTTTAPVRRAA